ncbi:MULTISPECIES: YjbH domain-containing protein [unclassified Ruegeria]|uniref:YjbH domain-containing protein n=1 Tax=unclassified Ruegeria TaxID=2625375 RepID=UPI0014876EC7|nr:MULTISPECIES: YjbH domain-containing protein [unclassified Ruegeria]
MSEPQIQTTYNTYGYPGLVELPSAHSRPDAELALNFSHFRNTTRTTLTFQVTPRLSGSLRYSALRDVRGNTPGAAVQDEIFDRSFSIHLRFLDESSRRPAMAIGLNDFLGTGIYQSEYIVASKTVRPNLRLTGGIGWGRLAGLGSFQNPLSYIFGSRMDTRPGREGDEGGTLQSQNWFRGPAALFGGIEWQIGDRWKLQAEFSPDAYPQEDGTAFDRKSSFNFAAQYRIRPDIHLSLTYLYGSEVGVNLSFALNPKDPPAAGLRGNAPPPVLVRGVNQMPSGTPADSRRRLAAALQQEGLRLQSLETHGDIAVVGVQGTSRTRTGQDIGRTARAMSRTLPAHIEQFEIALVVNGLTPTKVTIQRRDIEQLEHELDNSWSSYTRARIEELDQAIAGPRAAYPVWNNRISPYIQPALFDPDEPVRADFGVQASTQVEPARGVILRGILRQPLLGNLDDSDRPSDSTLPRVRSDGALYDAEGSPAITELTGAYYYQPAGDLFGRITGGYLEPMFGGLSAELLWFPLKSRFAMGAELNYVRQRDFNQLFGFQDYSVATGHLSGYWQMQNGFHTQIDAGRYLAGDWGATFTLHREFKNGWRIGAFATLTNVSAEDFGEGSFDKGIIVTIPIDWLSGSPTRDDFTTVLRPVQRDGGARLDVAGRLYDTVRGVRGHDLQVNWGRFWR